MLIALTALVILVASNCKIFNHKSYDFIIQNLEEKMELKQIKNVRII